MELFLFVLIIAAFITVATLIVLAELQALKEKISAMPTLDELNAVVDPLTGLAQQIAADVAELKTAGVEVPQETLDSLRNVGEILTNAHNAAVA